MTCLTIEEGNKFLAEDANRIQGKIVRSLAINSPYINLVEQGVFPAGVSDVQRAIVQGSVAPIISQASPEWNSFSCNQMPGEIKTGHKEYTYQPLMRFEKGPPFCVTQSFSAFEGAITSAENSISDHVQTLWNSWIRYQLYRLSATKIVARSDASSLAAVTARGFATTFVPGVTPDAPLSFKFLKAVANFMTHSLLAGDEFKWGSGMEKHFRVITDEASSDAIRNEIGAGGGGVLGDLRALATGRYDQGKEGLLNYHWEGPYRGLAFAVDQSILRASSINPDGTVNFVEPFRTIAGTQGEIRDINPAWLAAPYQVSMMAARVNFKRLIPQAYLGEGMTKFERQFWAGDIRWHNVKDNNCNIRGDTGFHHYTLAAAMRPERPEWVVPILHLRCQDDLGLTACTPQYYTESV